MRRQLKTFDRITFDPEIMGGKACIRGTRMTVSTLVKLVAAGLTFAEILDEYPDVEEEDIRQSLGYAAWVVSEDVIPAE